MILSKMEVIMADNKRASALAQDEVWPPLPLDAWRDTYATLHMWTQIVGKIRLELSPPENHWWGVALYLSSRGLTTSPMPYGQRTFQIDFDFVDDLLHVRASDGEARSLPLMPQSVASFYRSLMATLKNLGIDVRIWTMPVEIYDPIPFELDEVHAAYDAEYAHRFWRILGQVDQVLKRFRCDFTGKCSPVHFFWGSFDLAVTRFSGRKAPEHPGGNPTVADFVTREAYSHEVSSCGFWPGGGAVPEPAFYSYAYPEPAGFRDAKIEPPEAFYSSDLGEFVLRYDEMRSSGSPEDTLLAFAQSTYAAAATLASWDRRALERLCA
jgi:hypothetical protein